jgi:hypothetical protein
MITLTAKIDLISGGKISNATSNLNGNNISGTMPYGTTKYNTKNPFILGASKLGEGATLEDKVDYFIGAFPSDKDGSFGLNTPYTISVNSLQPLQTLTVAFDTENMRHPNIIGVTYGASSSNQKSFSFSDDDSIFTFRLPDNDGTRVILTINNWNAPYFPLVISGIYTTISLTLDKRNLISLSRSIFDRSDYKSPSYGIISNTGNIEFNDLDGEVRDYAEQMLLTSDLKVSINLNETISKKTEQIGVFETREWDYDNVNRSVSVSLKDDLEEWQDIQVKGFSYDPRNPKANLSHQSMADLYKWLFKETPIKYDMLSFSELDQDTQNILQDTIVPYPMLKDGLLWGQWQKLCEVCGLYIYKNNEGRTVCRYTYGS